MSRNFDKYYRILGLSRDASSQEIKQAYRRLAKKWHPDSLGPNVSLEEREYAEKKFSEITEAYKILMDHVRITEIIKSRQESNGEGKGTWKVDEVHNVSQATYDKRPSNSRRKMVWIGTIVVFLSVLLFLRFGSNKNRTIKYVIVKKNEGRLITTEPSGKRASNKSQNRLITVPQNEGGLRKRAFFSLYSNKEDVLKVQGAPNRISGKKWYYGLSSVTFENGRVVGYDNFDGRLKVKMIPQKLPGEIPQYFTIGSDKNEVLLVQGMPSRVVKSTWYYGLDKIFFENGRVVGYDNFTGRLKVKLFPHSLRGFPLKFFTIGSSRDEVLAVQGTPTKVIGDRWYYGLSEIIFKHGKVARVNNAIRNLKFIPPQLISKKKLSHSGGMQP